MTITGVDESTSALVIVVHHVVADGFGTIAQALKLLRPVIDPSAGVPDQTPGLTKMLAATTVGLAQLATESRPARWDDQPRGGHSFGTLLVPLAQVREVARAHQARVSDVLLTIVAEAAAQTQTTPVPDPLRVSVPLMVRRPGAAALGNVTAAVLIDLPLGELSPVERLRLVAAASARLRTGTRALASRFVMHVAGELLPAPVHARFARGVYGRRFFHAIVSNMPGPDQQLSFAGRPLTAAFPILPLAPGTPLALGALGWNGRLCLGISTDAATFGDLAAFTACAADALSALTADQGASQPTASRS